MSPVTVRRVRPEIPREVQRRFWVLIRAGLSTDDAAIAVGVSMGTGLRWFNHAGGMSPLSLMKQSGRYLSMAEREEIACGLAAGLAVRQIARRLGRDPSTVSREISARHLTAPRHGVSGHHRLGVCRSTRGPT